jgi:polysaccharide pyruvyl transferase WcaK-like protein
VKRKTILIFGHYGVPNWGDEAILAGILSHFDQKKYRIVIVSNSPFFTKQEYGVEAVYPPPFGIRSLLRGNFFQVFREIKKSSFVIFGGGGLFQERPPFAVHLWSYYLRIVAFFQKKILFLANSFEPMSFKREVKVSKLFRKYGSFFSVRDKESSELLKKWGVSEIKISSATDASFLLPIFKKRGRKSGVILALREGELSNEQEKKLLKMLVSIFPNEKISSLSMQKETARDDLFAIRNELSNIVPENLDQVRNAVASAKIVIANRLHAGILSCLSETPFLMISTRPKIAQFFGMEFCISQQKLFSKNGRKLLEQYFSTLPSLRKRIEEFVEIQKKNSEGIFPEVL